MKKFQEGSRAIAETINACSPQVVAVYPITPQTHIVEDLAKIKETQGAKYKYVKAESEHSVASVILGASATGVRTYTATSSQGLLLMTEVLFNIAGLRLPAVVTCANRALSAPINIWNDQQDVMTIRDSGWIIMFAENNQEAVDLHIEAYKIAEKKSLPVMVCVDGFTLTHTFEPIELRDEKLITKFIKTYQPKKESFLDPKNPVTIGGLSTPASYMSIRKNLYNEVMSSKTTIKESYAAFKKLFGIKKKKVDRKIDDGLIEYVGPVNPKNILVASGSVLGTIKSTFDYKMRQKEKIGILKVRCFRPFPEEEIRKLILKIKPKKITVIDRSVSMGSGGILFAEVKNACYKIFKGTIQNFIMGLGGKDMTVGDIKKITKQNTKSKQSINFIC